MKLQTQIPLISGGDKPIHYHSKVVLIGSCFVENIGEKLAYYKFQNSINPFGIMFHPVAIENNINLCLNTYTFSDEDVFKHNDLWHCFDVHSFLSQSSKNKLIQSLNKSVETARQQITQASHIIITLGTAWVYKFLEKNKIVANCHKIPQSEFKKELLSVNEISTSLNRIIEKIHSVNSEASIIFTVSPVRHLKDGFIENTQSKSHLIAAVHEIVNTENKSYYFPSYELMMDELRDYRFYKDDMLHPNSTAINYIWQKFKNVWISSKSEVTMQAVDVVQKGLSHKPFNPESKAHQEFVEQLKAQQNALNSLFSHIIF